RDGREPHALVAAACAAARGAVAPAPAPRVVAGGAMSDLDRLVQRVAAGSISILILGETGVGKEVLAERVHRTSPRADRPFLGLNCAALSEALLESELFGHERGAFTGADRAKPGLLETAQGGTVFLDEVGEMPLSTQAKLLRVIETREVLPVGGLKARSIDVRFVAATNRDLEVEVAAGRFRADLYYRLNGMSVVIPPLRQRLDELPALVGLFVAQFCRENGIAPEPQLTPGAIAVLESYAWPGNIRELRNVIERAVLVCGGGAIEPDDLPIETMRRRAQSITLQPPPSTAPAPSVVRRGAGAPEGVRAELAEIERARILEALESAGGNQTRAAQALGLSRRTLVNRLDELGLPRPRKGKGAAT
ncbi:MAG TPA: sigma 54-interacting transcriptional regulator, partial [Kofleriaceae bacterium]|nr:sigma 54-interacting transcriptional regulator [Kofleriaceae bacterium]